MSDQTFKICPNCGGHHPITACSYALTPSSLAAMPGSGLSLPVIVAIKTDNPIGTYDAYAEWLASHKQGYLYLKQAISALAWHLHKTGNLSMMRMAVDEVTAAERELVNEKVKAPNSDYTNSSSYNSKPIQ